MFENNTLPPTTKFSPDSVLRYSSGWDTRTWAIYWDRYGFDVIPIAPSIKLPAVKWDTLLDDLDSQKINKHWTEHPDHDVGCIVGEDIIVVVADTPESVAAIKDIEDRFDMTPRLAIKTTKGEHHYYRLAAGTLAKSDSHSSEKHPDRLDIKTGRDLVILPPSTGKIIKMNTTEDKGELEEATQEFIDAINLHNGRPAPSLSKEVTPRSFTQEEAHDASLQKIEALPKSIDPECGYEAVNPAKATYVSTPLDKYFLRDIDELEKMAVEQVSILGNIILLGQATVIYAKQNTGKTLITLHLIIEGIKAGKFDPSKLIYINMDDDSKGLAVKARLAEEYGFQMVADGHHGFEAKEFRKAMDHMIATNEARGFIVILDTLKKFVNTMNKRESSSFAKVVRQFVLKGGTVIALSHANKNPGSDGKAVYSGTTDILDDFCCGYMLTTVSQDPDKHVKIVEFENIKKRGNVALSAAYRYAHEPDIPYNELLLSVREVDPGQLVSTKHEAEVLSDAEVIVAIESCIAEGNNTKMKLATAAAGRAKCSQRLALQVIEKYTGNDPAIHRWSFVVRARGAKVFELLNRPIGQPPAPAITTP